MRLRRAVGVGCETARFFRLAAFSRFAASLRAAFGVSLSLAVSLFLAVLLLLSAASAFLARATALSNALRAAAAARSALRDSLRACFDAFFALFRRRFAVRARSTAEAAAFAVDSCSRLLVSTRARALRAAPFASAIGHSSPAYTTHQSSIVQIPKESLESRPAQRLLRRAYAVRHD